MCTKQPLPKSNIPTLLKNPQIGSDNLETLKVCKKTQKNSNIPASHKNPKFGPGNWKTSKVCKKTPTKSKKDIKTFEQTLQY